MLKVIAETKRANGLHIILMTAVCFLTGYEASLVASAQSVQENSAASMSRLTKNCALVRLPNTY